MRNAQAHTHTRIQLNKSEINTSLAMWTESVTRTSTLTINAEDKTKYAPNITVKNAQNKRTCTHLINITLHVANFLRYHYKIFYFSDPLSSKRRRIWKPYTEEWMRKKGQKSKLNSKINQKSTEKVHKQMPNKTFDNLLWHFSNHPLYFCYDFPQNVSVCGCTYPMYLLPCAYFIRTHARVMSECAQKNVCTHAKWGTH